jgi:hypothetical protein
MTLVVARAFQDALHFVSDTRRSLDRKVREKDPLIDGVLKCVLISRDVCVAFAGDIKAAEKAIGPLLQLRDGTRDDIRRHLLDWHRRSYKEFGISGVDFLLATSDPEAGIDKFCDNGIRTDLRVAWIGALAAFNRYQAEYASIEPSGFRSDEEDAPYRMHDALQMVISSGAVLDVGDLRIHTKGDRQNGFRYWPYDGSYGHLPVSGTTKPTSLLRSVGAEGGSFRLSVLVPQENGIGALGVYVVENRSGALFYPAHGWESRVYRAVSIAEFAERVRLEFGLTLRGVWGLSSLPGL